jgi:transposase
MYIDDWFEETDVPFAERMDDYQCSRLFASVSYGERMRFFKEWVGRRTEKEYIAYDVTSVSTYSSGLDIAEWGYNRDGEKLQQVNIGMFYGAESRLPVYYDMYNGSIADKSRLTFMMEGAEKLGISSTRFVFDRGFMTEENLKYMRREGNLFITAFPGHMTEAKNIIDGCKGAIRKSANRISAFDVYAVPVDINIYGFPMKAHVYYDPQKQALDEKELFAHIEKLKDNLEKISSDNSVTKKYTDFFKVEKKKREKFSFEPDNEKIDERLSRTGFFILLSNDSDVSSCDALRIYRGKDAIEENFDQLKNSLDFRRLRTHLNKTTDGKVFVGFLALILRSYLLRKVKDNPETKHLTLNKALLELRKIRSVTFEDASRALMPLTKLQRTILDAIGISHELLKKSFG